METIKLFEYVGGGAYQVGLPTRDLYASDMRRCAKQGWPRERIEKELGALYTPVDSELMDDIAAAEEAGEEYDVGETLGWDSVKADGVVPTADEPSDTPDELIDEEEV